MMSVISFTVMLLIMLIIPTLLYSLFFLINYPPNPFQLFRRRSTEAENFDVRGSTKMGDHKEEDEHKSKINMELVIMSSSKLGKDVECPVCLAVFLEGEELRQLKTCKHLFHKSCIDKWLSTHFNCPVCRAVVAKPKEKEHRALGSRNVGRSDFWQGLPDAAGLV